MGLFTYVVLLLLLSIVQVLHFHRSQARIKQLTHERDTWRTLVDQRAAIAQNFSRSCRLIEIKRDARFNYFTFARGNDVFTIETMGLLSDVPDEWRKQAGLDK